MYSRSSTEAGDTPAAPPPGPRDVHGAASLQATTKINYGVTVEDKEVMSNKLSYIVIIYNNLLHTVGRLTRTLMQTNRFFLPLFVFRGNEEI